MPQLDPTWFASQLFWLFVCFTLLYVLLSQLILPPIKATLERRATATDGDIAAAEQARDLAARARQDYEQTLAQSREMAHALINEVLEENKRHAEATLRELDVEIGKKLQEATMKMDAKKHELFAELTPATAEFTSMIAHKLTHKNITAESAGGAVMEIIKIKGSL